MSGLALGTLIYLATGSALLSALGMFGPSLAQLIGATTVLSAADRLPPRAAMAGSSWPSVWAPRRWLSPVCPCGPISPSSWPWAWSPRWAAACATGCSTRSCPGTVPAWPLGAEHVRGRHADLRVRGRRRAGGDLVIARHAAGRRGLYLAAAAMARFRLSRRPPRAAGRPSVGRPGGIMRGCGPPRRAATSISRCGCPTGSSSAANPCSSRTRPGTPGCSSPWPPWACWPGTPWPAGSCRASGGAARRPAAPAARRAVPDFVLDRRCPSQRPPSRLPRSGIRPPCCSSSA